jgi:hypothetical protein
MKKIIPFILLIVLSISVVSAQPGKEKKNPVGDWKFEAPYAPEGYTSGIITVSFAEKRYSAFMKFTGSDYQFSGENVKFQNDSLFFTLSVESENVAIRMKLLDNAIMSGNALYSGGDIPLSLARVTRESQNK